MTTIRDYLNKAKFVRDSILDETERIIYANEETIIRMNTDQIENSIGSDGMTLNNSIKTKSGKQKFQVW